MPENTAMSQLQHLRTQRQPHAAPCSMLCRPRHAIQGDRGAYQGTDALDRAEATIAALDVGDPQWPTIAEPLTLLREFQAFVAKAKGE